MAALQRRLRARATPLGLDAWNGWAAPPLGPSKETVFGAGGRAWLEAGLRPRPNHRRGRRRSVHLLIRDVPSVHA